MTITLQLPRTTVEPVQAISADPDRTRGSMRFRVTSDSHGTVVRVEIPRVVLSTILKIE